MPTKPQDKNVTSMSRNGTCGAYGLRFPELDLQSRFNCVPDSWPEWKVQWCRESHSGIQEITEDRAILDIKPHGQAYIDRLISTTTLSLPAPPTHEALVHPHLSSTALLAAHWRGDLAFHGGAVVVGDGVFGILGEREDGKSSSLAWFHRNGFKIFSDDLLVLRNNVLLAGPRCLDLRESAAQHFGMGEPLGVVGTRKRWRVSLPPVPPTLPLLGWISLAWGDKSAVRLLSLPERPRILSQHRGLRIPLRNHAEAWLPLLAVPFIEFTRPRSWTQLDEGMGVLLDQLLRIFGTDLARPTLLGKPNTLEERD